MLYSLFEVRHIYPDQGQKISIKVRNWLVVFQIIMDPSKKRVCQIDDETIQYM